MKLAWKTLGVALVIMAIVVPLVMYTPISAEAENGGESPNKPITIVCKGDRWKALVHKYFIKNTVPVEIEGNLAAHVRRLLILNVESEEVSVIVPRGWLVNGEAMRLSELFEEGYLNVGDELVITALEAAYTNENGVTFYIIFGYEIENQTNGSHLSAILPFNIEITEYF